MTNRTGSISVHTNDILPIIQKWLYSEHDIFLRELVSNATDAISKRKTIARTRNESIPDGEIIIRVNKKEKIIEVEDNGLGMSESDIEKYIAQLAFSGAQEFVDKMKQSGIEAKDDIIGKFGLGFFSTFMVASKVEVESLSMENGSTPAKWIYEGGTEYSFTECTRTQVGTLVRLHLNDESLDFLDKWKIRSTLVNYNNFMPAPIFLEYFNEKGEKEEQKDKDGNVTRDQINETTPLWRKDPTTLKDEDYIEFYHKLFPMDQDPLFWLHLNVDHPFNLQGILYFPKLNPHKPVNESNIRLFCKQVFVSDNVKNVIPEFLGLLKGAIDSSDIPLNVSRSALQGDPNIQKISNYIVKKVAESLRKLFNTEREKYENVWSDIALFVKYGIITNTKFEEQMKDFVIFKNSDDKYVTLEEYAKSIPESYKEKIQEKVLYFEEGKSDRALRRQLHDENIQTITTESYIDPHFMQHMEMKASGDKKLRFCSIDSEIENILGQENVQESDMKLKEIFENTLGTKDVEVKNIKNSKSPAYFKADEQMKRFQQMAKMMGPSALDMPLKKTLVINPAHPLIQSLAKLWEKQEQQETAKKLCNHIKDLALISSEGISNEEKDAFVQRSQDLLIELSSKIK